MYKLGKPLQNKYETLDRQSTPQFQDIQESLRKKRASFDDNSRPGDLFHRNFQYGRPAYFDVSVHSTLQSFHISSSASGAGVAAVAGGG